jgi:cell division septation protein DedD
VAAVTKQQDAEALADALRKKQYPVFIVKVPTDTLFHVQIGPFQEVQDADNFRNRLIKDGYNPIVKK